MGYRFFTYHDKKTYPDWYEINRRIFMIAKKHHSYWEIRYILENYTISGVSRVNKGFVKKGLAKGFLKTADPGDAASILLRVKGWKIKK